MLASIAAPEIVRANRAPTDASPPEHTTFRNEAVLRGMVARGHGLEAISAYLQQSPEEILDAVVGLDLPTPHDRPLRQSSSPKAWKASDYLPLIQHWLAGFHAATIGERFGRSAGAIWAKARWLGLPKRDRRSIVRPHGEAAPACEAIEEAGQFVTDEDGNRIPLQRKAGTGQLRWIRDLDIVLGKLWLGNVHHRVIAKLWGVSPGVISSRASRLELPPRDRSQLVAHYDPAVAARNIAEGGFIYRACKSKPGWFFWCQRGRTISKLGRKALQRRSSGFCEDYSVSYDLGSLAL